MLVYETGNHAFAMTNLGVSTARVQVTFWSWDFVRIAGRLDLHSHWSSGYKPRFNIFWPNNPPWAHKMKGHTPSKCAKQLTWLLCAKTTWILQPDGCVVTMAEPALIHPNPSTLRTKMKIARYSSLFNAVSCNFVCHIQFIISWWQI